MGCAGIVAIVTIWLTAPRLWCVARETSLDRAEENGSGPAWWWPKSWQVAYIDRLIDLISTTDISVIDSEWGEIHALDYSSHALVTLPPGLLTELDNEAATAGSERFAIIRRAPDFVLSDQSGRLFRMDDSIGKVLLVSFIFTTCNGSCPATTHRMSLVQQELKSRGLLKDDRVRLVSITLDPARDTPEALARYMRLYDADPEHWSFLTGPVEDVHKTIAAWDMWVRPAANGQLDHPSRIFLVDQKGRVREIYNLSFLKPAWVADDVRSLLDEPRRDESPPKTGDR